ncbi:hypothetical protein QT972_14780 [Microcoleus sp. herbarium7]|uniref:hypothetical protein n=1 Tax=Microcoleus sp. herbarium7 TaxID=3055435 RepID=UPI002FD4B882
MDFSIDLAKSLIDSPEEFPVDFEEAWIWLGYSKKQNAKEKLTRSFDKDVDYVITQVRVNSSQQGFQGGRPSEQIRLTIDCSGYVFLVNVSGACYAGDTSLAK